MICIETMFRGEARLSRGWFRWNSVLLGMASDYYGEVYADNIAKYCAYPEDAYSTVVIHELIHLCDSRWSEESVVNAERAISIVHERRCEEQ